MSCLEYFGIAALIIVVLVSVVRIVVWACSLRLTRGQRHGLGVAIFVVGGFWPATLPVCLFAAVAFATGCLCWLIGRIAGGKSTEEKQ